MGITYQAVVGQMHTRAEATTTSECHVAATIRVVNAGLGTKFVKQETVRPEVIRALVDFRVMEHAPVVDEDGRAGGNTVAAILSRANE